MLRSVEEILRGTQPGQGRGSGDRPVAIARGAAQQVQALSQVPGFRVLSVAARDYQSLWRVSRGSQDRLAPLYGFVDYQRQMIVVAVPTATRGLLSQDTGVLPDTGVVSSSSIDGTVER